MWRRRVAVLRPQTSLRRANHACNHAAGRTAAQSGSRAAAGRQSTERGRNAWRREQRGAHVGCNQTLGGGATESERVAWGGAIYPRGRRIAVAGEVGQRDWDNMCPLKVRVYRVPSFTCYHIPAVYSSMIWMRLSCKHTTVT